jgi:hypothetical protein
MVALVYVCYSSLTLRLNLAAPHVNNSDGLGRVM